MKGRKMSPQSLWVALCEWVRPWPPLQKFIVFGCYVVPAVLAILMLGLAMLVNPAGLQKELASAGKPPVSAQPQREKENSDQKQADDLRKRREQVAERKREEEVRKQEEAAAKKRAAQEADQAKRRLEVNVSPSEANATLYLNGQYVAEQSGGGTFENLKLGPQYVLNVAAAKHETKKVNVTLPRSGAVYVSLTELPDLEVLSTAPESNDGFGWWATGKIRNNTDRTYSYVQVQIGLEDAQGNLAGSTMDNVNNLRPGQIWSFRALVTDDNVETWRIEDVTGF